jgi:hypothetical protein
VAQQVSIAGAGTTAKIRSIFAPALLPIVTLGIFGTSPGTSVLAITLGALVVVPAILSVINTFERVQKAQRLAGVEVLNGWIGLVLYIVLSPAFFAYVQSGLNDAWKAQATQ